jgi:hypothetical protein
MLRFGTGKPRIRSRFRTPASCSPPTFRGRPYYLIIMPGANLVQPALQVPTFQVVDTLIGIIYDTNTQTRQSRRALQTVLHSTMDTDQILILEEQSEASAYNAKSKLQILPK